MHVGKSSCIIHPMIVTSNVKLDTRPLSIRNMEGNHINVVYVGEPSLIFSFLMKEITMERKLINVRNVGKPSGCSKALKDT